VNGHPDGDADPERRKDRVEQHGPARNKPVPAGAFFGTFRPPRLLQILPFGIDRSSR